MKCIVGAAYDVDGGNKKTGTGYAGDITPQSNNAVLVDVRTPEEWQAGRP